MYCVMLCKYDELKVSLIVKADSASGFWQITFSFFRKIFIQIKEYI